MTPPTTVGDVTLSSVLTQLPENLQGGEPPAFLAPA